MENTEATEAMKPMKEATKEAAEAMKKLDAATKEARQ